MKKTNLCVKLLAAVLVVCMATMLFASCNKKAETIAMIFEKDGKVYTITEEEFDMLMKVRKRIFFCNLLYPSSKDTASFWAEKSAEDEEKTNEQYYMGLVMDQVKAVLIEKYLFDTCKDAKGNALAISQDTLDGYQTSLKSAVKETGGQGAYKQYYGYTAKSYYAIYEPMVTRSDMLFNALTDSTKGTGELAATAEDLKAYYEEHYVGYQYIVIDVANKVVLDADGNRVVNKVKDEEGKEVDGDSYKTEKLDKTKEEDKAIIEKKENLAASILAELKKEGVTFESMIEKHSDEYYSVEYPEGWFVDKEGSFINSTVTSKVKDLEIGEVTGEAIKVGDKRYIVKKIALKDYVYDEFERDAEGQIVKDESGKEVENKYFEFFEEFESTVNYDKYEKYVETFFDDIVVKNDVIGNYTMADTFLSPYVDDYYRMILYYYYGIQI